MKKIAIAVCALLLVSGGAGYGIYQWNAGKTEEASMTKEVFVSYGNVTAGVTESAAVSVDSLSQTYDLELVSTTLSASVESSGNTEGTGGMSAMGGGMNMMGGMNMGGASGGMTMGSTSVSSSSASSSVELVVAEVFITEGQSVTEGDVIMSMTEESISTARAELTQAVTDAELALKQAQIEESETLLSAKYEYDTRIAEGSAAESTYNAALSEISSNISTLQSQISETESEIAELEANGQTGMQLTQAKSQLENYKSQLSSAQSSRSADELTAKQTYEEALLYYENAQSLYDVAVSEVGDATADAQEEVETAKENLETFEAYVSDGNIRAEYSGTVTAVGYAAGDTLSSDTAIAEFADAETITVTVNVTEDDIAAVSLDDSVSITFLSYPDESFTGYVSEIGSSTSEGSTSTVSYPVTVVVSTMPDMLLTGMTANVTFITKQVTDVLYVSNKAVTTEGTSAYVTRLGTNGEKERIAVQTGFSNGSDVEISGDIAEGDTLLIEGGVS